MGYDDYDPWGYALQWRTQPTEWSATQGVAEDRFTGNAFDDDFGLNWGYHVDRFYDSEVGRWWSVDPIEQYSLSPYVYGADNPLRFVDPFGADTLGSEKNPYPHPEVVVEAERPVGKSIYSGIGLTGLGTIALTEPTPVGEVIFVVGSAIYAGYRIGQYLSEDASSEEESITDPPTDPKQPPGKDWVWRGKPGSRPGDKDGNWYNPKTGESLRPDLDHPPPVGPRWDYKDPSGSWWRIQPDGTKVPKL